MISEDEDCKLVVQMWSKEALKVRKDEGAEKLCKDAAWGDANRLYCKYPRESPTFP